MAAARTPSSWKSACIWKKYDGGTMGFINYEYKTSCGNIIQEENLPSGEYCPYCGSNKIIRGA